MFLSGVFLEPDLLLMYQYTVNVIIKYMNNRGEQIGDLRQKFSNLMVKSLRACNEQVDISCKIKAKRITTKQLILYFLL